MADQAIGQLLDTLGVTADLDQGDLAVDALVLLKVVCTDGKVAIIVGASETLDWVSQTGLLHGAIELTRGGAEEDG